MAHGDGNRTFQEGGEVRWKTHSSIHAPDHITPLQEIFTLESVLGERQLVCVRMRFDCIRKGMRPETYFERVSNLSLPRERHLQTEPDLVRGCAHHIHRIADLLTRAEICDKGERPRHTWQIDGVLRTSMRWQPFGEHKLGLASQIVTLYRPNSHK